MHNWDRILVRVWKITNHVMRAASWGHVSTFDNFSIICGLIAVFGKALTMLGDKIAPDISSQLRQNAAANEAVC